MEVEDWGARGLRVKATGQASGDGRQLGNAETATHLAAGAGVGASSEGMPDADGETGGISSCFGLLLSGDDILMYAWTELSMGRVLKPPPPPPPLLLLMLMLLRCCRRC